MHNPSLTYAYAENLFDGVMEAPIRNAVIEMENGVITSLRHGVPPNDVPSNAIRAPIATPGLIDLQINGAGDVQFNHDLTVPGLQRMLDASARGGAAYIFPTFTTAPGNAYQRAVDVVLTALSLGVEGIAGLHLEGPFISTERAGIHRREFIRPMTTEDVDFLCCAAGKLKILLTVAPEKQDPVLLKKLSQAGIVIFAGHSNATYEEMQAAVSMGVVGTTHLFNAMSQTTARQPGLVGAALGGSLFAGIIADGHHVHDVNLKIAADLLPERLCLVTDAMQTMNGETTSFELYEKKISLHNGKLTSGDSTIGGAHLSMAEGLTNMVQMTGTQLGRAVIFASANPAASVGLDRVVGKISPGYEATLSMFDCSLTCTGIIRKGHPLPMTHLA